MKNLHWNNLVRKNLWARNKYIVSYGNGQRDTIEFVKTLKERDWKKWGTNYPESYNIFRIAKSCQKTEGMYAEVGVYRGASAKVIWHAKGDKRFAIFDTFEGIPRIEAIDSEEFQEGDYAVSVEDVRAYLGACESIEIVKGIFPDSAHAYSNENFSFVHLDVDTYQSSKGCLEFFYPLMNRGGIIVSHDYQTVKGVTKAFDEFFADKPEIVLEISSTQCAVVRV